MREEAWCTSGPIDRRHPLELREEVDVPPVVLVEWSVQTRRGRLPRGTGPPPWRTPQSPSRHDLTYDVAWGPSVCVLRLNARDAGERAWHRLKEGIRGSLASTTIRVVQPRFRLTRDSRSLRIESADQRRWTTRLHGIGHFVLIRNCTLAQRPIAGLVAEMPALCLILCSPTSYEQ